MLIRQARVSEHHELEALQRRASLNNPGDREALLGHPDAITLPIDQIAGGSVFVAERDGVIVGFAAVVPRDDGGAELDALFVEPHDWKRGIERALVDHCSQIGRGYLHCLHQRHGHARRLRAYDHCRSAVRIGRISPLNFKHPQSDCRQRVAVIEFQTIAAANDYQRKS